MCAVVRDSKKKRYVSNERNDSTSLFGSLRLRFGDAFVQLGDTSAPHKVDRDLSVESRRQPTTVMKNRSILALAGAAVLTATGPCNALSFPVVPFGMSIPFAARHRRQRQDPRPHSSMLPSAAAPTPPAMPPHSSSAAGSGPSLDPTLSINSIDEFNELCRKSIEEARSQLYYLYGEGAASTTTSRAD
jgi:hypothetical protein